MSQPALRYGPTRHDFRRHVLRRLSGPLASRQWFGAARHKLVLVPVALALVYALLISGYAIVLTEALVIMLCLVAALGIAHDATHGALRQGPLANRLAAIVFDLVGVDGPVWHFDHVLAHHNTPNVSRHDANLYGWGPIRLDPHAPLRRWHRWQHVYAWLVYATASLYKVYLGDFLRVRSASALARLVLFKLGSIAFTLVLPLWATGQPYAVGAGYLLGHACNGLLMGAVFQPTHTNERVAWPRPDASGRIATSFDEHVLATAVDFAVDSPWITWLAGGLNIHAVHHLFPHVPQLELPEAAQIVADVARLHGLEYRTFPTWGAALASHYRALRALGRSTP